MAVRTVHKDQLDEIEKRMEELRRKFDLYFMGSPEQKTPPTTHQAQVGGELRRMREDEVRTWKTIERFRFAQIFARFVSMDRLWARTLKQIEDGIYKRDKFRVQQGKKKAQEAAPTDTAVGNRPAGLDSFDNMDVDVDSFSDEGLIHSHPPTAAIQSGKAPPAPRGAPAPIAGMPPAPQHRAAAPPSGGGQGMSEQRIKQLYDVYMQAKKRSGEASSLTLDQLKKQIDKQVPQIKAKHKCDNVDFKVVLKDGKAMLKAVPK